MLILQLMYLYIMQDLEKIVSKFEINVNDHFRLIKNKLFFDFGSTLSLSYLYSCTCSCYFCCFPL